MQAIQTISSTSAAASSANPLPQRWVAELFSRLSGQLGAKMLDLYAGVKPDVVQSEWAQGLAGFTPDEISRGLAECRTRQFAPSIGEFSRFCRPALDPEVAWYEAQDGLRARERGELGVWSHPAVWRAASAMPYEVKSTTFHAARKRWEMVLRKEFESGWGEDVPPVPKRVEHRPTLTFMSDAMRKSLADLNLQFRGMKSI